MKRFFNISFTFSFKDLRRRATQVGIRLGRNPDTEYFLNGQSARELTLPFTLLRNSATVFLLTGLTDLTNVLPVNQPESSSPDSYRVLISNF
jgi:hypothetical protein